MAFRWRVDDGPFIVVFGSYIPSLTTLTKKVVKFGTPLIKLFGSAHARQKFSTNESTVQALFGLI